MHSDLAYKTRFEPFKTRFEPYPPRFEMESPDSELQPFRSLECAVPFSIVVKPARDLSLRNATRCKDKDKRREKGRCGRGGREHTVDRVDKG